MTRPESVSKQELLAQLRRAGVPETTIERLDAELGDPVDYRSSGPLFSRLGLSLDGLISDMGGSP